MFLEWLKAFYKAQKVIVSFSWAMKQRAGKSSCGMFMESVCLVLGWLFVYTVSLNSRNKHVRYYLHSTDEKWAHRSSASSDSYLNAKSVIGAQACPTPSPFCHLKPYLFYWTEAGLWSIIIWFVPPVLFSDNGRGILSDEKKGRCQKNAYFSFTILGSPEYSGGW